MGRHLTRPSMHGNFASTSLGLGAPWPQVNSNPSIVIVIVVVGLSTPKWDLLRVLYLLGIVSIPTRDQVPTKSLQDLILILEVVKHGCVLL